MASGTHPSRYTRLATARAVVVLLLSLLAALLVPTTASAHAEFTGSSPEDGAVLSEPPSSVELRFSEPLIEGLNTVVVTDEQGEQLATDEPEVSHATLSVALPHSDPGRYSVAFRIVSQDGHPVTGEIEFAVTGADATEPTPTPSPTPSPVPPEHTDADGASENASTPWWWLGAIPVGLAALGGAGYLLLRRGRTSGGTSGDE
ncbi:copper resistance protein CopC [Haloechinothrix sp. LS1_15]|uniref:copper resistance CopC family protein n=1 Tax=Haloechinothrix sp. LS1_15 TaxID=2652248 RepID=UPI00294AA8EF|nr:copper resistance protein CopC [Haloechinothrix sp. LS1_15]